MQTHTITAEERARRQASASYATHELRLESLIVSDAAQAIVQLHINGQISTDEVIAQIKGLYVPSRIRPASTRSVANVGGVRAGMVRQTVPRVRELLNQMDDPEGREFTKQILKRIEQ